MSVFQKKYRRGHVEIYFSGLKIFSFNKDRNILARLLSSRKNAADNIHNKEIIDNWPNAENCGRRVLFVVRSLESAGGIETRLNKFASALLDRGILPCFLVMYHEYAPLKAYPAFRLSMDAPDFQTDLEKLIVTAGISAVEFQIRWESFLEKFDWPRLRKICRTGCTVHEAHDFPWSIITSMDYSVFVREKNLDKVSNGHLVLNGADRIEPDWTYEEQKKAVFISRLTEEKLPTLLSFCDFCRKNSLHGEIAAPLHAEALRIKDMVHGRYGQEAFTFLGEVATVPFLKEHGREYLFCAGVGQVIAESIALGMPALVCSHLGSEHSTFLSEENFSRLHTKNFVIATPGDIPLTQDISFVRRWKVPESMLARISFRYQFEKWLNIVYPDVSAAH